MDNFTFLDVSSKIIKPELIVFCNNERISFGANESKKIKIDLNDINCCSICNKQIDNKIIKNTIKTTKPIDNTIDNTLIEIEIETVHKQCKKLQKKYIKLKNQLCSVEWQLFKKREQ